MRSRMSSDRLCGVSLYTTGLGAYCKQASLKPARTVAVEPLQERHLLSMVMTGSVSCAAAAAFLRGVLVASPDGRAGELVTRLRRLPLSSSGKVQALEPSSLDGYGACLPSTPLYPKSDMLLRSWSSCKSSMAPKSSLSTIIARTSFLPPWPPPRPRPGLSRSFKRFRSWLTSRVRELPSASPRSAKASNCSRNSPSLLSARLLTFAISSRSSFSEACPLSTSTFISFRVPESFSSSVPYFARMSSICRAVDTPTTWRADWKFAFTSDTRPFSCCLRPATCSFSCREKA
mmetsp:Transcript_86696/g.253725  ORF Transcript_86696/g.253725 Transcript_86696/m.253725 type:complete len:289 (+) Transcript_86696:127-993(+)